MVKKLKKSKKERRCLKCDKLFKSKHRFNKLCKRCGEKNKELPEEMGVIK